MLNEGEISFAPVAVLPDPSFAVQRPSIYVLARSEKVSYLRERNHRTSLLLVSLPSQPSARRQLRSEDGREAYEEAQGAGESHEWLEQRFFEVEWASFPVSCSLRGLRLTLTWS